MEPTSPANIITQHQFEHDTTDWITYIGAGPTTPVQGLFETPSIERIASMTLPMQQLVWLLSSVGVSQIKARFMITRTAGVPSFALALYAVNIQGDRISAYFTADAAPAAPAPGTNSGARLGEQIPNDLASGWLNTWTSTPGLTAALFTMSGDPVQGYNFELSDFMNPLFAAQPLAGKLLYLDFNLHTYFPAVEADDESPLTHTFGLLVRIDGAGAPSSAARYYDMATPCPPTI